MPGAGRHRFEFVGKEPLVFRALAVLFIASMFFDLALVFGARYFLSRASASAPPCEALASDGIQYHAPEIICWYASRSNEINLVLFALLVGTMLIFRKRVR